MEPALEPLATNAFTLVLHVVGKIAREQLNLYTKSIILAPVEISRPLAYRHSRS